MMWGCSNEKGRFHQQNYRLNLLRPKQDILVFFVKNRAFVGEKQSALMKLWSLGWRKDRGRCIYIR